jgi:hypothetical protein
VKPERVPSALDAHCNWRGQGRVETFDVVAGVRQLLVPKLARVRVDQRDLLFPRMEIASDQNHEFSLHWYDVVALGSAEATSDVWLFS